MLVPSPTCMDVWKAESFRPLPVNPQSAAVCLQLFTLTPKPIEIILNLAEDARKGCLFHSAEPRLSTHTGRNMNTALIRVN